MARTAVVAGTATAVVGGVRGHQQQAAAQQQQAAAAAAAPPPPPVEAGDDPMAKIRQLAEMKDQGLLTEEEFTSAKAKVLATI
jgi:hypothetical protein